MSLFGASIFDNQPKDNKAPSTTTSNFFQNTLQPQNQTPTFQSKVVSNPNSSLFTQPSTTTSLFDQKNTNTTTPLFNSSQSLFSNTNTNTSTTNLFQSSNTQTQNQNPNAININYSLVTNFLNAPALINQQNSKRNIENLNEIKQILQNFNESMNTQSPSNLFKYFFYSKIPQNCNISQFTNYYPYLQTEKGINCIDYHLWEEAVKKNKNPESYYPLQISSPEQLVYRLKKEEFNQLGAVEEIIMMENEIDQKNAVYSGTIEEQLNKVMMNKKKIKNLLTKVSTKMAILANRIGKSEKDFNLEKKIEEKIVFVNKKIEDETGLRNKLEKIKKESIDNWTNEIDGDAFTRINKSRLDKNFGVIKQLKIIIDKLYGNLDHNLKIVNGIQDDLDHYHKYGYFKK